MNDLKHVHGRVIVRVDLQAKNYHTFSDGTKIRLERDFNNLDVRYTKISQGEVIDAEYIPAGAIVLFHPNSTHDSNKIFNYGQLSGDETASDIKYFSIPEEEIYLYRIGEGEYMPLKGFVTALRVYVPYSGMLFGIDPSIIKDTLYITSGHLKDKVVLTLRASDYQLIFQEINGREGNLIRCRHWEDDEFHEREEIVAIHHEYTKKVKEGELLVGLSPTDAKPINELVSDHYI